MDIMPNMVERATMPKDEKILKLGKELINQGSYNLGAIEEWKHNL